MTRVRTLIYNLEVSNLSPVKLYEAIMGNVDTRHAVIAVLNSLETVSLAVQTGYANEKVLHANMGFIVPFVYKRLQPFITLYREHFHCASLYIKLEQLATTWELGIYFASGEAIPEKLIYRVDGLTSDVQRNDKGTIGDEQ